MTETTRDAECSASATLYLAFELGSTKWVLAFTAQHGDVSGRGCGRLPAGDLAALAAGDR